MKTLYFVRHGDYANPNHIMPFRSNAVHLSDLGKEQTKKNGEFLSTKGIQKLYSSPVVRAVETAEILKTFLNLEVNVDERLIEVRSVYQDYDLAKYNAMVHEARGDLYENKFHIEHHGETPLEVYSRVKSLVDEILNDSNLDNIVLVSHGDPIMIFLRKELGEDFTDPIHLQSYIPKGGILVMKFDEGKLSDHEEVNY